VLAQVLERLLNDWLSLDARSAGRLRRLQGKAMAVVVSGTGWRINLRAEDGRLRVAGGSAAVDATLYGAPWSLLSLARSDGVRPLFSGLVQVRGDTETAKRFKRLFDSLDVDWEEQLAGCLGDYPAHRALRWARGLAGWARRSGRVLGEDLGDYLREERRLLCDPHAATRLHDAVDTLRADVERLTARVARYERRRAGPPR